VEQRRTAAWAALAAVLAAGAAWLLYIGRGMSFGGDDLYYYMEWVVHAGGSTVVNHGLEYFFAPANGHLQTVGKVIYRLLFGIFGADYDAFRVVDVLGILAVAAVFYLLAARRLGPLLPLAPTILILFLGYAWELSLWAFDMHTVYSLAFGLGALLALEREDRRGDVAASVLLVLSVFTIELGLAFVVGAIVLVGQRSRWRSRAWIVLVPIVLYAIWWVWARQFGFSTFDLHNLRLLPPDIADALGSVFGSILGLNPTGPEIAPEATATTSAGMVAAGFAVAGLALRLGRGAVPPTLWAFLAVALAYWTMIALGGRLPDSSRYVMPGTVMVLLVAADALAGRRFPPLAVAGAFVLLAVVLPPNIAKFYDGRHKQLIGAQAGRTEFAMMELAGSRISPSYSPPLDEEVVKLGGSFGPALIPREYFSAARRYGSLAYSLEQVREDPIGFRQMADAALADAIRLRPRLAAAPAGAGGCEDYDPPAPGTLGYLPLPKTGLLLRARGGQPVEIRVSRFAKDGGGFEVGQLRPGRWAILRPGADPAPDPWRLLMGGPLRVCPAGPA